MHTDRAAEAYIASYLLNCGEDPENYHTHWAAEELHRLCGTWDMDQTPLKTFERVVSDSFDVEALMPNYY